MDYEFEHHGIRGQKWGQRNGPPYPLGSGDHSVSERKAGWRKSLNHPNALSDREKEKQARKYSRKINRAERKAAEATADMLIKKYNYHKTLESDDARLRKLALKKLKQQEKTGKDVTNPEKDRKKIVSIYKPTTKANKEYKLSQEKWFEMESKLKQVISEAKDKGYTMTSLPKDHLIKGKSIVDRILRNNGLKAVIRGSQWEVSVDEEAMKEIRRRQMAAAAVSSFARQYAESEKRRKAAIDRANNSLHKVVEYNRNR